MGRGISFSKVAWGAKEEKAHVLQGGDVVDKQDEIDETTNTKRKRMTSDEFKETKNDEPKVTVNEEDEVEYDNDSDSDDDEFHIGSVSLGSGDAWPCYWRPWFIASYRMVLSKSEDELQAPKELILNTILACCPPDHLQIDNSSVPCGNIVHILDSASHRSRGFGGLGANFGGLWASFGGLGANFGGLLGIEQQKIIDEAKCLKAENRTVLDAINMDSMVDLLLIHNRAHLPSSVIKRVSSTLQMLDPFLPMDIQDLKGTPYDEYSDGHYQLADERWKELKNNFIKAAQAEFAIAFIE